MKSFSYYIYAIFISLSLGIAIGRYSARGITQTTGVTKDVSADRDTKKITVVITAPDGKKTTTETTEIDTHLSTDVRKTVDTQVKAKMPVVNFSALIGTDVTKRFEPIYGISITREVAGPVTAGIWMISNGTVGASIGVNF